MHYQRWQKTGDAGDAALRTNRGVSPEDRFWMKVNKTDGCWLWTAATFAYGYGIFRVDGRNQYAHRVAWELTNGPIPDGLSCLHRCDVPGCVNPDHLFLGTQGDNARDRNAKGRAASKKGPLNGRWKGGVSSGYRKREGLSVNDYGRRLTPRGVQVVREMYASGAHTQYSIADYLSIDRNIVRRVLSGRHYGWVE